MEVTIVANGVIRSGAWFRKNVRGVVIAADGGADLCLRHRVTPEYVIGDFDSVTKKALAFLKKRSTLVHAPNQNQTDLEKAIQFARTLGATHITVLGALGDELDHTLANLLALGPECVMKDETHDIRVVTRSFAFSGKPGGLVSVIALSPVSGLSYRGLRWSAPKGKLPSGWSGVRNRLTTRKAEIRLTRGKVAVIRTP